MSIGALLYILVYTLLGFFLGQPVLDFLERIHIPFALLGSLVPLSLILLWTYKARQALGRRTDTSLPVDRQLQLRAGALAGGLATISSTLLFNVVINLAGNIAFNTPGTLVEQTAARLAFAFARELQPLLLFVAAPAYLAVGVLWGVLYAVWVEPRLPRDWPDWLKGLVFALLPLMGSLIVVMPLLGLGGFLGVGAAGQVVAVGELIRHAAYGVQLGLLYPIFRTRRPVRVIAHTPDEVPPGRVANAGAEP
jgi:hypothetical protein